MVGSRHSSASIWHRRPCDVLGPSLSIDLVNMTFNSTRLFQTPPISGRNGSMVEGKVTGEVSVDLLARAVRLGDAISS
jgi:hypothetical protein